MWNWLLNDLLQEVAPKLLGGVIALGAAHLGFLQSWGINLDWNTLGGKLTTGLALLLGMLAGHHTANAVIPGKTGS